MKTPHPSMILGVTALILSLLAIGLHWFPLGGALSNGRDASLPGTATAPPDGARLVQTGPAVASVETDPAAASATDILLEEQSRRIAGLERQLAQLGQVIRASGLDVAPPFVNGPPGGEPWLASMGEQYATRARFDEGRKKMAEHSTTMRQRDLDTYGAEGFQRIAELSEMARPRRGNESQSERSARESALSSLMTEYPESWATSVAVAEQALDAAMNRNSQGAEMYYQSLIGTSPYSEVVTGQGIDAIPTLQTYLARQYVQEGRYDEASAMLDALSTHTDSLIMEPNEMGEPTAKPVQEIVTDLRARLGR